MTQRCLVVLRTIKLKSNIPYNKLGKRRSNQPWVKCCELSFLKNVLLTEIILKAKITNLYKPKWNVEYPF